MDRYALLVVTPQQPRYFVPAVFSARLWSWAGFRPVVYALGDWSGTALTARVLSMLRGLAEVRQRRLPPVCRWSHHPLFHAATAPRRLWAALEFEDAAYVMLGDADMLLLDNQYLNGLSAVALQVWGADMYDEAESRWPACYQGGTAAVWRAVMQPGSTDPEVATLCHMERTREYAESRFGKWDCEPGFHAELAQRSGAVPVETFRRGPLGAYKGRLYVRRPVLLPTRPVDCHIRGDWFADGKWALLGEHRGRVPGHVWDAMCRDRAAILAGLAQWREQAEEQAAL